LANRNVSNSLVLSSVYLNTYKLILSQKLIGDSINVKEDPLDPSIMIIYESSFVENVQYNIVETVFNDNMTNNFTFSQK
jgi:hypothetical protein